MDPYRSKDWKAFREQVIRLDGGICSSCGRSPSDGVSLHVHHTAYISGRKPWEYPFGMCHTLCGGCHAAEHGIVRPRFGWEYAGWEDLGSLIGTCDCCGSSLRYSFMVTHPDWHPMEVGESCCDNLTSEQVASGFMESRRRYASRLKRFVSSSRWRRCPVGGHLIRQGHLAVRIAEFSTGFRISVNGHQGRTVHKNVMEAKIAFFEARESGAIDKFLANRHRKYR